MRKTYCAIVVLLTCAVAFTACGKDESREDANDVRNGQVDKSAPSVAAFNNKFSNIEHKCLYDRGDNDPRGAGTGLRIVVTTSKRIIVIPDPHCPGFRREQLGIGGVASTP